MNPVAAFVRRRGFPFTRPTWPGGVPRPPVERRTGEDFDTEWARKYPTRLARAMVLDTVGQAAIRVVASPKIAGADRLDHLKGPAIFAANHASHVDTPLLLTCLPDRFRHHAAVAAGADYFFDKRWKGRMWGFLINAFPIERRKASPRSVRMTGRLLDEGWSIIIFPEGGRSPHGWGQPHTPGAAFLGLRHNVPVVPVHLEGTRRILKRGAKTITPSRTTVTFGTPMRADEGEDARAYAARIERAVAALADEQATDWWTARLNAARQASPALTGPTGVASWRRTWALGEGRRRSERVQRWPKR